MRAHRSAILNGFASILLLVAAVCFLTRTAIQAGGVACLAAAILMIVGLLS